jgi:hypothetical protein
MYDILLASGFFLLILTPSLIAMRFRRRKTLRNVQPKTTAAEAVTVQVVEHVAEASSDPHPLRS